MQFETESAARADGRDIIATNTISLRYRYNTSIFFNDMGMKDVTGLLKSLGDSPGPDF